MKAILNKRFLAGLMASIMVLSIFLNIDLPLKVKAATEDELVEAEITTYDFIELGVGESKEYAKDQDLALGDDKGYGGNVAIKAKVTAEGNYRLGLMKTDNALFSYNGYWIIFRNADGTNDDYIQINKSESSAVTTQLGTKYIELSATYELEVGIVDMCNAETNEVEARKIYVKINGEKVVEGIDNDATGWTVGNKTAVRTWGTLKMESALKEATPTVYDFIELGVGESKEYAKDQDLALGDDKGYGGNVAIKAKVTAEGNYRLGLMMTSNSVFSKSGYCINARYSEGYIAIHKGDPELVRTTITYTSNYTLEVGIVDMKDSQTDEVKARKIYVKIDGNEVVKVIDKDVTGWTTGNKTAVRTWGTLKMETALEEATTNVYDFYDLTSKASIPGQDMTYTTDALSNYAIKMRVNTEQRMEGGSYYFPLSNADTDWWDGNDGYRIRFDTNSTVGDMIRIEKGNTTNVLATLNQSIPNNYKLEYGIVDMKDSQTDEVKARRIYVKINGIEVLSAIDTKVDYVNSMGTYILFHQADTSVVLSTAMVTKEQKTYDFGELGLGSSYVYDTTYSSAGTQITETGTEKNVAIKTYVTAETEFSSWFYLMNDVVNIWDSAKGYKIALLYNQKGDEDSIQISRGGTSLGSRYLQLPTDYVLEIGAVEVYRNETATEAYARKIYVQINGVEVYAAFDKNLTDDTGLGSKVVLGTWGAMTLQTAKVSTELDLTTETANTGGNVSQIYLDTMSVRDYFPISGTNAIVALDGDENGVFLDGSKLTDAKIYKDADGKLKVNVSNVTVGSKITVKGEFQGSGYTIEYDEVSFWWNGEGWYTEWIGGEAATTGDINGDGVVDVKDIIRMKRSYDEEKRVPIRTENATRVSESTEQNTFMAALRKKLLELWASVA